MDAKGNPFSHYLDRNIVALGVSMALIFVLYFTIGGYQWVVKELAYENIHYIWRYPELSIEKKWRVKNGIDFRYLNFIKKNTPENAVIWMPSKSDIYPPGTESPFTREPGGIKNKAWCYYYLYPRKPIYKPDEAGPRVIDYVAIVNGKGYDRLSYEVSKKNTHTVLPYKN